MELISVIIPVYKVESYLNGCVQSIVNQTYRNLEIILVDDGSPDRCPEICDAWAVKDSRIKVIHQKNAGGAQARNVALDAAHGDLIAFVDSDDYIYPGMYEELVHLLEQGYDIAECDFQEVWDSDSSFPESSGHTQAYTPQEAMKAHIEDSVFRQLIWNKLYRKQVVDGVRFPKGKSIDDEFFTYRLLGNAKRLIRTDRVFYAYRQQQDSVMHSMGAGKRMQALEAKQQRHAYILEHFPELEMLSLTDLWFTALYQGQLALREMPPKDSDDALSEIERALHQFPFSGSRYTELTTKEKLWIAFANASFGIACRLRNTLKIGL